MAKIPSLTPRTEPTRDEFGDGRGDERDARLDAAERGADPAERNAARRASVARAATGKTGATTLRARERARTTARPDDHAPERDRPADGEPPGAGLDRDGRSAAPESQTTRRSGDLDGRDTDRGRLGSDRDRDGRSDAGVTATEPAAPAGPRPRASLLATLGLIFGVTGALFVLSGALAGYGIGLGGLAVVLSVFGATATRRRHVAGRSDAMIGVLLGLGAVVLGVLAMTGQFVWPTTEGDWVVRFREWLDSQFAARL